MPSRPPDRTLRRLVGELSHASAEDIRLVLAGLEPDQRRRVAAMLEGLADDNAPAPKPPTPEASMTVAHLEGLSPWLALRLERSAGVAPSLRPTRRVGRTFSAPSLEDASFALTETVKAALQDSARELQPQYAAAVPTARDGSLLERLHGLVTRRESFP